MKYRKKPIVIEAIQWDGSRKNLIKIKALSDTRKVTIDKDKESKGVSLLIETLEGVMKANQRDFIIKGVSGEIYPCKPDIFEKTYEKVEE